MKYFFHPEAEIELNEAIEYYEQVQSGLGLDFAQEVYATISRIQKYPSAWTQITTNTRRCLTNRFPFGIIYQIKTGALNIIAVANLNRRPRYWKDRL